MVDQSRRDRIGLGLIGLGSNWESVYRETLIGLENRLKVRMIYDPVEARARSVAADFEADVAGSLRQILARPTLQGLMVIDPGWLSTGALNLISRYRKPVYLARPAMRQAASLRTASSCGCDSGQKSQFDEDFWFPELGLRFTPASCRLRELIATKLGRVEQIIVEYDAAIDLLELAHLIDWCTNLIGHSSGRSTIRNGPSSPGSPVEIEFPPLPRSSKSRVVRLHSRTDLSGVARFRVCCERGEASFDERTRIVWNTQAGSAEESLVDERSETEILIDQFCRRAVGGLIPVGRLSDYFQAIEIAESLI